MLEASHKGFSFKFLSAQSFLPSSLGSDCSPKAVTDSGKGAGRVSWFWLARTHSMEGVRERDNARQDSCSMIADGAGWGPSGKAI